MRNFLYIRLKIRHLWLLLVLGFTQVQAQGVLRLDLGSDTLYACASEVLEINPSITGGTSPYSYLWYDGRVQADLTYLPLVNDSLWIWLEVTDGSANVVRDSMLIIAFGNCIWPGDMNGDGAANHVDLLEWGRAAGTVGPIRPNAHTNWIGQTSPDWGPKLPGGHDYAYADANGDGIVHLDDIDAIEKNYVRQSVSNGGIINSQLPISYNFPSDSTFYAGDTVRIPVFLGLPNLPADSVFGLAMSFLYDNSIVKEAYADFSGSWLGTQQQDLVGMERDFNSAGQLDVSLTRINQIARSGQGKVFDIIVTIDNIAGKNNDALTLRLEATAPRLLRSNGNMALLAPSSLDIEVLASPAPRNPEPTLEVMTISPNPTVERLIIKPGNQGVKQIQLLDLTGKIVKAETLEREMPFTWAVSDLERGRYYLRIQAFDGSWQGRSILLIE